MKTLLIKPNSKNKQYGCVKSLTGIEPPLWLSILANKYSNPFIIDAEALDIDEGTLCQKVFLQHPDLCIILATGSHPSAHIQQKEAMRVLKYSLEILDLKVEVYDKLPINPIECGQPRWDLLDLNKYRAHNWHSWGYKDRHPYGTIYTSISCPFNCEFCCIKSFYNNKFQFRPVDDVMEDFEYLANNNVIHIKMMDELFVFHQKRANEILDKLIAINYDFNIWAYARIDTVNPQILEKLKKAGVNWLAYGIETGNDDIRKNILKGNFNKQKIRDVVKMTKDYGIHIVGNYMFGFWEDNIKTMKETLDFAKELNTEYANFYCTVAYPESKLYEIMKSKKIYLPKNSTEYAQMSYDFHPLSTKYLHEKQVLKFRDEAFKEYFNNVKYLSMIKQIFGIDVVNEIIEMTKIDIERKILNDITS